MFIQYMYANHIRLESCYPYMLLFLINHWTQKQETSKMKNTFIILRNKAGYKCFRIQILQNITKAPKTSTVQMLFLFLTS